MNEDYDIIESDEEFTALDDVRRADVQAASQYKYLPLDEVKVRGDDTKYWIGGTENGKYWLCDKNGDKVHNGKLYEERDLTWYNPLAQ